MKLQMAVSLGGHRIPVDSSNFQTALTTFEQIIASSAPADCPALVGELERLKAMAWSKMMQGAGGTVPYSPVTPEQGHYLRVEEVAERFHVSAKWLYRHKRQMPHSQPSRKCLLFPEQAITKWFASRKQT
jgi:hypothetical protein